MLRAISSLIQYTEQEETASEEESCNPKKGVGKVASVAWRHVFGSQRLEQRLTQDEGDKGEASLRRTKFTAPG
ncbi:hypothetical protein CapIbe_002811 [Capra ibex]